MKTLYSSSTSFRQQGLTFIALLPLFLSAAVSSGQTSGPKGTISADMFNLHYNIEGEGPNALVVGSANYYPRVFSENLKGHLRMVFLDHRGFAPSPGTVDTSAFALDKILDDMERARQELGLGDVIVIGHSGHSFMALEYAKKYPEHVTHVVMIGTAPDFSDEKSSLIKQQFNESVDPHRKEVLETRRNAMPDAEILEKPVNDHFRLFYVRDGALAWYDPEFDSSPLWENVQMNPAMMEYMWGGVFKRIDITENLGSMNIPVFIALGRYDYLVPPAYTWESCRSHFQDVTIRVFEKSGHTPMFEQPEEFDKQLLSWLNNH